MALVQQGSRKLEELEVQRTLLEEAGKMILSAFGRSTDERGLERTPERFANFFLEENNEDPAEILRTGLFKEDSSDMVVQNGITFYSLCEHHLAPFFGTATVGYIPTENVIGLSKLTRLVRVVALGPNVQERITTRVADYIEEVAQAKAVGVILKAHHLCMSARGVKAESAETRTSAIRGIFKEPGSSARAEFLRLADLGN
jgi:GTP cyclohydrolase IA